MCVVYTMRHRLLKYLRRLEYIDIFKYRYIEFDDEYCCDYSIEVTLNYPDTRYIIEGFKSENHFAQYTDYQISAELTRLERDGVIYIASQDGYKQCIARSTNGPDWENIAITTDKIILTTIGRSSFAYYLHKIKKDPLSVFSLLISLIA